MVILDKISAFLFSEKMLWSIITVIVALIVWTILRKFFLKLIHDNRIAIKKANNLRMILGVLKYAVFIIAGMLILEINGVNVTALVTGIGLASVVVGFALQDMLKDIIMGANIFMDDYFQVGDIVSYDTIKLGEVASFDIKATRILDLDTGNIVLVSNRSISSITKVSDWQTLDVPAPYWEKAERMRAVCLEICEEAKKSEYVKDCTFLGTGELADSAIYYKLYIVSEPKLKPFARRAVLAAVQDVYEAEHIDIPYSQLDVHLDR